MSQRFIKIKKKARTIPQRLTLDDRLNSKNSVPDSAKRSFTTCGTHFPNTVEW